MDGIKAEYIDHLGSDLTVTNAARVSFDKESDWDFNCDGDCWQCHCDGVTKILSQADQKLIAYLAKHNHFTPFTHCVITLRETVPIFVARQRFKHTVGFTYNEISRRYVDDTPEFYTPDVWRKRAENVKQGSSDEGIDLQAATKYEYEMFLRKAEELYNEMLFDGVAPEQARMVLPQSMMTSYYTTGSLFAFARAYLLRSDDHSQKEIQMLAVEWDKLIRPLYPVSWSALVDK